MGGHKNSFIDGNINLPALELRGTLVIARVCRLEARPREPRNGENSGRQPARRMSRWEELAAALIPR